MTTRYICSLSLLQVVRGWIPPVNCNVLSHSLLCLWGLHVISLCHSGTLNEPTLQQLMTAIYMCSSNHSYCFQHLHNVRAGYVARNRATVVYKCLSLNWLTSLLLPRAGLYQASHITLLSISCTQVKWIIQLKHPQKPANYFTFRLLQGLRIHTTFLHVDLQWPLAWE